MNTSIRRTGALIAVVLCAAIVDPDTSSAFGLGPASGPPVIYEMESAGPRDGAVTAEVSLDRVLFALNTVGTSLRVVPVEVRNEGDESLFLSRRADRVHTVVEGREVQGTFVLSEADPELWESLSQGVREWVSYPDEIGGRGSDILYAFFDASRVQEMPEGFVVEIASLDGALRLKEMPRRAIAE